MRRRYPNRQRRELLVWVFILTGALIGAAYFAVYLPFLAPR